MKRFRYLLAVVLAFALVAAACGDDDAETTTSEAPATTEAPTTTETPATTEAPPETTEAPPETTMAPEEGKTLIIGTTDAIASLDPADAYATHDWELIKNTGEGLLKWKPGTAELEVGIAEDFGEFSEDGLSYTIALKDGIVFGDGTPLDAQAYADYINQRLLVLEGPNGVGPALGQPYVESVEALDDLTIKFNLTGQFAFFPQLLAGAPYIPSNPNTFPMDDLNLYPDAPIYGVGPYYIEDYVQDEQLTLKANPLYYGEQPPVETIIMRYFGDPQTMALAVQSGEIDIAWRILGPDIIANLEGVEGLTTTTIDAGPIRYLIVNHQMEPFDDSNVRQAIAWLVDRDELSDQVFGGAVTPLYSPVPPGFLGATEVFDDLYPGPDIDEAVALLAASGYTEDNKLVFDMWYPPEHYGGTVVDAMQVLKEQIEASGVVEVNLQAQEWSTYIGAVLGGQDYPISFLGWFYDYPDPDNYMSPFIQNGGLGTMVTDPDTGEVIEGLDPRLLDLLIEAATTPGTETREALYEELQIVYGEAVTTLPLWIEPEHIVFRDGVFGSEMYQYPEALNIGPTTEFNYNTLDTE